MLAHPYLAVCRLQPGQVKRLPSLGPTPHLLVVACPACGWKAQLMAPKFAIADKPQLQSQPAARCDGCGVSFAIKDGEFEISGTPTTK